MRNSSEEESGALRGRCHEGKGHGAALPMQCCISGDSGSGVPWISPAVGKALSPEGLPFPECCELGPVWDAGMGGSRRDLPQAWGACCSHLSPAGLQAGSGLSQ